MLAIIKRPRTIGIMQCCCTMYTMELNISTNPVTMLFTKVKPKSFNIFLFEYLILESNKVYFQLKAYH